MKILLQNIHTRCSGAAQVQIALTAVNRMETVTPGLTLSSSGT